MNIFAQLFSSKPNASDAARALNARRWQSEREHIKLTAQRMREELRLPNDPRLA